MTYTELGEIERKFKRAAKSLFTSIEHFNYQLTQKERRLKRETIGLIEEDEEKGAHYEANILNYLDGLDRIRHNYSRTINRLSARITETIHRAKRDLTKKQAKNFRRDIWLAFATSLRSFAGRPSKKMAALLVDDQDYLIAWDVNHVCYGIEKIPALLAKGKDGNRAYLFWCAERNVIAQFLDVRATMPHDRSAASLHIAVNLFMQSLIGAAIYNSDLKKMTLITGHYPCVPCAEVIAPEGEPTKHRHGHKRIAAVKEVVAYWDENYEGRLKNPDRRTAAAQKLLRKAEVKENLKMLAA